MPPDTPAGAPTTLAAIAGFCVVTADFPRLTRFYQSVLGFTADAPERPIAPDEMALLGLRGSGQRQVLSLGDQRLSIDHYEHAGRAYPERGDAASLWFQHLALVVTDMAQAYARVADATPISSGGPQHLPAASGGVHAFKFRDPDGHPLELLQFPPDAPSPAWRGRAVTGAQIGLGIDHSAISVADREASIAFYRRHGLTPGKQTLNQGLAQQQLDHLANVEVAVVPMLPGGGTAHLELLGYRVPRGASGPPLQANDVAATRVFWHGRQPALLRDPDGHLQQVAATRTQQPAGAT